MRHTTPVGSTSFQGSDSRLMTAALLAQLLQCPKSSINGKNLRMKCSIGTWRCSPPTILDACCSRTAGGSKQRRGSPHGRLPDVAILLKLWSCSKAPSSLGCHDIVLLLAAAARWPRRSPRGRLLELDGAILHPAAATVPSFSAGPPLNGAAGLRVATCSTAPSSPRSCHGTVLLRAAAARRCCRSPRGHLLDSAMAIASLLMIRPDLCN